ncbi:MULTISPECIES: hypothetical protein [Bacillus]|uniref:Uncharacterized protein n=1 Tax=Bacillus infantis TaxID=324767 RepID=A0A5D4SN86_9BACI|nr:MULTISPECIES: hypothetical protein [Bacillus]OXT18321.1 hypothetical protein B9K06_07420 [Bacillus sp. OG2]SIA81115.1 Uncharacterised protein [Mycobacteroides abscessus subsp. abscessus]MCK6208044.1 hypothetical protein [Bacillus infantis]MDT0162568.1 hypothetical protein [Bacillus sp. AG4(2022)]TYS64837.1 hypothetical protein FZD47_05570 [Bacillus infantis]
MKKMIGPAKIHFDDIFIGQITDSSGVFMGRNRQKNWSSDMNGTSGFGSVAGDLNKISGNLHLVQPEGKKGKESYK